MKRREIIKRTAIMTGAALSAPLIASLAVSCNVERVAKSSVEGLKYFDEASFDIVKVVVDLILPKTDSPSATEVGVHHVIDHMVATVYDAEAQKDYFGKFQKMGIHLSTLDFFNQSKSDQLATLKTIQNYDDEGLNELRSGLTNLRQQAIAYYLSSEEISTKYLNYLPVPGGWEPCTPVSKVDGKAWAI